MNEKTSPTTIQISQNAHSKLKQIATFTGQSQSQIVDEFIKTLYDSVAAEIPTALKTGYLIGFGYSVKSKLKVPIVSGSFQCAINAPEAETNKIRDEMIVKQFAEIDQQNEDRKTVFEKALKE